jgi:hypothetical protein
MAMKSLRFVSLLFTAIVLGAGLAHLFALPNKIHLPREEYLTVQQIYRGWALLGIVLIVALISTLVLTVKVRRRPRTFALTLTALLCIAVALVVFFTFTYPANRQTENWTMLPDDWQKLRIQWEYSHAAGAVLHLIALCALIGSVLASDESDRSGREITAAVNEERESIHA